MCGFLDEVGQKGNYDKVLSNQRKRLIKKKDKYQE